ncbi:hypothetical protein T07_3372 [Trichinella nelsoni]|uniref:Uncharacterized protein n=1 Tax=Trichinella nelsoni TaxID=6336 RepID=A0A0V0RS43_9BILA|nr:hypothetical protein T07_3372 [Trichinella nelsoni]
MLISKEDELPPRGCLRSSLALAERESDFYSIEALICIFEYFYFDMEQVSFEKMKGVEKKRRYCFIMKNVQRQQYQHQQPCWLIKENFMRLNLLVFSFSLFIVPLNE